MEDAETQRAIALVVDLVQTADARRISRERSVGCLVTVLSELVPAVVEAACAEARARLHLDPAESRATATAGSSPGS